MINIEQWIFSFRNDGLLQFESISMKPNETMDINKRETVSWIIKHPSENKYLILARPTGQKRFLGGWVEQWETPEQAMKRELIEEIWFIDFDILWQIWNPIFSHFQHPSKNINLLAKTYFFFIKLTSENTQEVDPEELKKHEAQWIEEDKFFDYCTAPIGRLVWNRYQNVYKNSWDNYDVFDQKYIWESI